MAMSAAKVFSVFVAFQAVDRLTRPMQGMAREMGRLNQQSEKLQKTLNGFKNMAWAGAGITAFGAVMADGLMHAVDAAGRLQMSMLGVKTALHLTGTEYTKAMRLAQTTGIPTIFSSEEVGGIMKAMAVSGLGKKQVMNPRLLQQYVDYADVQAQLKHESAPDVVADAITQAHKYGIYSTQKTSRFLNYLNAALLHTHSTSSEFMTQMGYFSGVARKMGMTANQATLTEAWLTRMGLGGQRGGTNFNQMLMRSAMGMGKAHDAAMRAAGFVQNGHSVFIHNGKFVGLDQTMQIMQGFERRLGGNTEREMALLKNIYGMYGMRAALLFGMKGAGEQLTRVRTQIAQTGTVNSIQERLNKAWLGQKKQFWTTLQDIEQVFGQAAMPGLLNLLKILNRLSGAVLKFTQDHPALMKFVATFAEIAAAAALVVGPLMSMVVGMGYLFASGLVTTGIGMVVAALGDGLVVLTAFAGAAALLYKAWTGNWGGIRTYVQGVFKDFRDYYFNDTNYATKMWDKKGKHFIHVTNNMTIAWNAFTSTMMNSWRAVSNFIDKVLDTWEAILGSKTHGEWEASATSNRLFDMAMKNPKYRHNALIMRSITAGMAANAPMSTFPAHTAAFMAANKAAAEASYKAGKFGLYAQHSHLVPWQRGLRWMGDVFRGGTAGGSLYSPGEIGSLVRIGSRPSVKVVVQKGAIVVHQQPGEDGKALSNRVLKELGRTLTRKSYASPTEPQPAWP